MRRFGACKRLPVSPFRGIIAARKYTGRATRHHQDAKPIVWEVTLMDHGSLTRRQFIRAGAMAASIAAKVTILERNPLFVSSRVVAPSDTVRFASIGTGVRGCELLGASLRVPGAECVGVCDLYDSRHDAARAALRSTRFPPTPANKRLIGTLFWMVRPNVPLTPFDSSGGAALQIMAKAWRVTSLFT